MTLTEELGPVVSVAPYLENEVRIWVALEIESEWHSPSKKPTS